MAGPFYLTVGLAQALLREGFDFSRHPLSVLANGPGGWVQTANFAAAWAMRRRGASLLALISLFSGLAVVLGFFSGIVFPPGILGIWIAVVVGWLWLAVMSLGVTRLM